MKNFHEIEILSSYIDGQLNEAESRRLETRLAADPELASALSDIRATRNILRKLPARKAPRNFTLTRKMVGLKPPLPRTYSLFQFSTAFAAVLLMLTFAANSLFPITGVGGAAAPAPAAYGFGGSGGGNDTAMQEAPAATEAPAVAMEAPAEEIAPSPTMDDGTLRETDPSASTLQTPKEAESEPVVVDQAPVKMEARIPSVWQFILLAIILLSMTAMWLTKISAARKWR